MLNSKSWFYASVIVEMTVDGGLIMRMVLTCRFSDPKEKNPKTFSLDEGKGAPYLPLGMGASHFVAGIIQIQTLSRERRFPVHLHWAVLLVTVQSCWTARVLVQ